MNNINYLTFSGVLMGLAGIVLLTSESIGIDNSKILVPLMFAGGGILAYMFSEANKQHKIARQHHLLQGIGMILFAMIIAIAPESLGDFLKYITYFMLLFAFFEIIFSFMAINSGNKLNMGILISRFVIGFFNLIGAVLILATSATDEMSGLMIAGVLILLGGISYVVFSFKVRKLA